MTDHDVLRAITPLVLAEKWTLDDGDWPLILNHGEEAIATFPLDDDEANAARQFVRAHVCLHALDMEAKLRGLLETLSVAVSFYKPLISAEWSHKAQDEMREARALLARIEKAKS